MIRVGRFAGQYAKPRCEDIETRGDVSLPSYRGDLINRPALTLAARTPDPELLLRGYERAALTLNFIRSLIEGGFADLHHPEYWDLGLVQHSPHAAEYHRRVEAIRESVWFMETVIGPGGRRGQPGRLLHQPRGPAPAFTSRRRPGRCLTARAGTTSRPTSRGSACAPPRSAAPTSSTSAASATRSAVKVGPAMTVDGLLALADTLDPGHEPGRLTLIHRFGQKKIAECLPPLIEAVRRAGRTVLWVCDPMHGNTEVHGKGVKTRRFDDILSELEQAFEIHAACGSYLGGVHFEVTGDDVTECIGGARGLDEEGLQRAYRSTVDPRLNYEQALEMALLIARRGAKRG